MSEQTVDIWQAQQAFWSSFGVPALRHAGTIEKSDRDEILASYGGYITYEAASGGIDTTALISAFVWTRSEKWNKAEEIADTIFNALGGAAGGGKIQPYTGGVLWFTPEPNFAQDMADEKDDMIKAKQITVVLHF